MSTHPAKRHEKKAAPHKHHCEECYSRTGKPCNGRGYCECKCGATRGVSLSSDWVKSKACAVASGPHRSFEGPGFIELATSALDELKL